MILRRVTTHVREQNWTAIGIDFLIVVVGVFVGLQVNLWNEARVESHRRDQIIDALMTNLNDAIAVQERFVAEIDTGLSDWEAASARGERPPPFHFRIDGSDTEILPGLIQGEDAFYDADRTFEQNCRRADFRLDGMGD